MGSGKYFRHHSVLELLKLLAIAKPGAALIFAGNSWFAVQLPVDGEIGVIPRNRPLVLGSIEVGGLVGDMSGFRDDPESMSHSDRYPQHAFVFARQTERLPFSQLRGTLPQVKHHVQNFTCDGAYKLSLRLLNLVVESAQHIPAGIGMIVLNEFVANSQFRKHSLVITLQEKSSIITEDSRFEQQYSGQTGFYFLHGGCLVARALRKPAPARAATSMHRKNFSASFARWLPVVVP